MSAQEPEVDLATRLAIKGAIADAAADRAINGELDIENVPEMEEDDDEGDDDDDDSDATPFPFPKTTLRKFPSLTALVRDIQ